MLRGFLAAFTFAAALSHAHADDIRLPPGTRKDATGTLVSGRGLRDTTDTIAKDLAAKGIAATQIGPSGVRGVQLTRFVSQTASTPWLAIHILRSAGKTLIFFVPRQALDETRHTH